ncbi:hypothetical protein KOW79_006584 [Hemibagrus wyckioides]|uniref:Uncharacterized protein n=1 Tax=Hemibagrus wyckioides TaxID=337641 RepID=A0A9D3P0M5_9TELE|nr:hypothetical protein KOW79_006584 [Hemibagrus wyckioides]
MSKLIVMAVTLVILATILSVNSETDHQMIHSNPQHLRLTLPSEHQHVNTQRSPRQTSEIPCTCILQGNHITGVKRNSTHVTPLNGQGGRRKPAKTTVFGVSIPV